MLNTAYCTVQEANEINNSDAWNILVDEEKQKALDWGRVYLDRYYKCGLFVYDDLDSNDPNELEVINAFKSANAVLGDKYANGLLFEASGTTERAISEKEVKAGSVSTRTKYSNPSTSETYDPFPEITSLLYPYCSRTTSTFSIHPVIRG